MIRSSGPRDREQRGHENRVTKKKKKNRQKKTDQKTYSSLTPRQKRRFHHGITWLQWELVLYPTVFLSLFFCSFSELFFFFFVSLMPHLPRVTDDGLETERE